PGEQSRGRGGAPHALPDGRQPRPNSVVPRRRRTRSPRQDPLPCGLRRPLPDVREEPQRGPARARRGAVGLPLVGAREPAREALARPERPRLVGPGALTIPAVAFVT